MTATELSTKIIGNFGGYEAHEVISHENVYPDTAAWLVEKIKSGISGIKNVTTKVVVVNNHGLAWEAFDEPTSKGTLRTVFEIKK